MTFDDMLQAVSKTSHRVPGPSECAKAKRMTGIPFCSSQLYITRGILLLVFWGVTLGPEAWTANFREI